MKTNIYFLLKKIYTSRKTVIFELVITILISVLSLVLVKNNGFRLIVSISCILCIFLIPIFKIFWNGFDNDKFIVFFTKRQLIRRDIAIRYSPKLFIALIVYMNISFFFEKTNVQQYIFCSIIISVLLILNTVLFFYFNLKK